MIHRGIPVDSSSVVLSFLPLVLCRWFGLIVKSLLINVSCLFVIRLSTGFPRLWLARLAGYSRCLGSAWVVMNITAAPYTTTTFN